jgi:predicted PurR-regulated permease PerM
VTGTRTRFAKKIDAEVAPAHAQRDPSVLSAPTDIRSIALTILAVLAVIAVLHFAAAVIIPVVLGVLISYALDPVVTAMNRIGLPRPLAAAVALLVVVCGLGGLGYGLRGEVSSIIRDLPQAARRIRQSFERDQPGAGTAIEHVKQAAAELDKAAAAAAAAPTPPPAGVTRVQVESPPVDFSGYLVWGSMNLVAAGMSAILILFLSFFLLASGNLFRRKIVKIAGPSLEKKKITVQILDEIDRQIAWFLMVQVFTSVVVGVASWVAFSRAGLNQAAVWGFLAGVLNSVPYLGPVVVTGGISIVAFLQFGDIGTAAFVAALALVITTVEGFLLTPWLTSRAARMNAPAIFVGLLFWGWVWNVWGMLLAVPMLMVIKAVCDRVEDFKPVGEILGE